MVPLFPTDLSQFVLTENWDFRNTSVFFPHTRSIQELDTKVRLSIPSPSSSHPLAEIGQLKKLTLAPGPGSRPTLNFENHTSN